MSILHVDLNSFYAHCSILASNGKYSFDSPVIIGGDPRKRHGIVLAATYPVKKKGVHAAMTLREACELCPEAAVLPGDHKLYTEYSRRFMRIIKEYSPLVMRFGIDEAYIDYTGCEHIFGPPEEVAHIIRERVKREIGLTVSVGVGDNMLMAKMGSDYKKPDAVTVVTKEFWDEHIKPLAVDRLMYVGHASAKKLNELGIFTIGQLASLSPNVLKGLFGAVGQDMWLHANGVDERRITFEDEAQKSISSAVTLPGDIQSRDELTAALLTQVDKVAYRLRSMGMKECCVGVSVRYKDLTNRSRQTRLRTATDVTDELYAEAKQLILPLYAEKPIRQVGVKVAQLTDGAEQLSLFGEKEHERKRSMDLAVDELRKRFGTGIVLRGSTVKHGLRDDAEDDFSPFSR